MTHPFFRHTFRTGILNTAMSTVPKKRISPQEYLCQERAAAFKSEYFEGETFAMAGASRIHNLIVANLVREAGNSLKHRPCEVYPSDLRVRIESTGLYTYPDVTILSGEPRFEDGIRDTLLNPTLIIEFLSDSTEAYDRGTKAAHYRRIPSLREYVLIATDRYSVECQVRHDDAPWSLRETSDPVADVVFESLGIVIPMAEIYRHVTFEVSNSPGTPQAGQLR